MLKVRVTKKPGKRTHTVKKEVEAPSIIWSAGVVGESKVGLRVADAKRAMALQHQINSASQFITLITQEDALVLAKALENTGKKFYPVRFNYSASDASMLIFNHSDAFPSSAHPIGDITDMWKNPYYSDCIVRQKIKVEGAVRALVYPENIGDVEVSPAAQNLYGGKWKKLENHIRQRDLAGIQYIGMIQTLDEIPLK